MTSYIMEFADYLLMKAYLLFSELQFSNNILGTVGG